MVTDGAGKAVEAVLRASEHPELQRFGDVVGGRLEFQLANTRSVVKQF